MHNVPKWIVIIIIIIIIIIGQMRTVLIILTMFSSVICIALVHQNAKLIVPCKFYRECINCRKDSLRRDIFHAKLVVNKFFGKLKRVEWVLHIDLDEKREAETESCFYCDVDFHYPNSF